MKPGRNDPCPCGSGKKYKKCCEEKSGSNSPAPKPSTKGLAPTPAECNQLVALFNAGHLVELERQVRLLLDRCHDSGFAWKTLGVALQLQGKDSLLALQKATEFLPNDAEAHYNLGNTLKEMGRLDEAESSYRWALQIKPGFIQAHYNLGITLHEMERLGEAEASYRQALQIKPDFADAYNNLGTTIKCLGRLDEAEASYRQALQIRPDFADAQNNLGNTLYEMGRLGEAEASYQRALQIKPDYAEAHNNLCNILRELGRLNEAVDSGRRALAIRPDYAEAYGNLGNALQSIGRLDEAEASYRRALQIKPDYAQAHSNLGNTLHSMGRPDEAEASYRQALEIDPGYAFAFGQYLHSKMHCCNWEGIDGDFHELLDGIDAGKAVSPPFTLLAIPSTPAQQKRCAEIWIQKYYPDVPLSSSVNTRYSHDKIRLGYFSADFYSHATAYLMAELLEQHDRTRFEVIGFSYGAFPDDSMRQRLREWEITKVPLIMFSYCKDGGAAYEDNDLGAERGVH